MFLLHSVAPKVFEYLCRILKCDKYCNSVKQLWISKRFNYLLKGMKLLE